jgi:hypothetical protein
MDIPAPASDDGTGILGAMREFVIDDSAWRVFEFKSPVSPSAPPRLTFGTNGVFRQATTYPANWRHVDPEALILLVGWASEVDD